MFPISPYTPKLRGMVAAMGLALALFGAPAFGSGEYEPAGKSGPPATAAAPVRRASAPVSGPGAAAPRQASPPGRAASGTAREIAELRAQRLQRLYIESCRRRPQTCVQAQSNAHPASAPAMAR